MADHSTDPLAYAVGHNLTFLRDALKRGDREIVKSSLLELDVARHEGLLLTEVAVELKEAGHLSEALDLLTKVVSEHPSCAPALYETAVLHRIQDCPHDAIGYLLKARAAAPEHVRSKILLAHMLFSVGAYGDALEEIGSDEDYETVVAKEVAVLRNFGHYLREFPRSRAHHILDEVGRRFRWIGASDVGRAIRAAIQQGAGFSLVRLGDGEGAYARISPPDEQQYNVLYSWLRREWASLLYGDAFNPITTGYEGLTQGLMETATRADVIGVPYRDWVDHEYAISSVRGIPCLLNVHRFLLLGSMTPQVLLCDQSIHIQLHKQGILAPIIQESPKLGIISCLAGLPEKIRSVFGCGDIEVFQIPGEQYTSGLRDTSSLKGSHFPFVYWDIVQRLSRPLQGRLFLIAAGTLAKFYADVVKQNGGVAIDVGSLMDGWMRINSRPGYGEELAL